MRRELGSSVSERAREIPALVFALAWLIGVEVGPALHLARHAQLGPHDHGRPAVHCHGGVCHEDAAADHEHEAATDEHEAATDEREAATDEREAPTPDHGQGSLEHGGLAVIVPAPVIPALLGAPIAELLALSPSSEWCGALRAERPRARAPPSAVVPV